MASPLLDEEHIKQLLRAPATLDYINTLQAGAAGTAIDLYDRKVTREEMADGLQRVLVLYAQCAKLYMLASIEDLFKQGILTQDSFDVATTGLKSMIQRHAESVIDLVQRLQQCPEDEDKIH